MARTRSRVIALAVTIVVAAVFGAGVGMAGSGQVEANSELSGKRLFDKETFGGNGRTCATCHSRETGTFSASDAQARLTALLPRARQRGVLDAAGAGVIDRLADRVAAGTFDTAEPPGRLHGDLWSGNVLWTEIGRAHV